MASVAPIVWIGTRNGLLRWQAGAVAHVGRDGHVVALGRLPAGRIVAGFDDGALLLATPEGVTRELGRLGDGTPLRSLVALAPERWLCAAADGSLHESDDGGRRFALRWRVPGGAGTPLDLVAVPGRPRSLLLHAADGGTWLLADLGAPPAAWRNGEAPRIERLFAHPQDAQVWLAGGERRMWRSIDGARTFSAVGAWPERLAPRALLFDDAPGGAAFALAAAPPEPPDPDGPSPLWLSSDGAQSFQAVASRRIDAERDPSGELTALALLRDAGGRRLVLGSDRGELLAWRPDGPRAALLASELPPIEHLVATGPSPLLEPSSSGIFLLP